MSRGTSNSRIMTGLNHVEFPNIALPLQIVMFHAGLNRIELANLDGTMRKVFVWEGLDKPWAISLLYEERWVV